MYCICFLFFFFVLPITVFFFYQTSFFYFVQKQPVAIWDSHLPGLFSHIIPRDQSTVAAIHDVSRCLADAAKDISLCCFHASYRSWFDDIDLINLQLLFIDHFKLQHNILFCDDYVLSDAFLRYIIKIVSKHMPMYENVSPLDEISAYFVTLVDDIYILDIIL